MYLYVVLGVLGVSIIILRVSPGCICMVYQECRVYPYGALGVQGVYL